MSHRRNIRARRRKSAGFTLVELLTVVFIIAVLMDVALPLYLDALADSQKKTCRHNLETIADAVQAARVKKILPNYSTFAGAVSTTLEPDLTQVPMCPNGGAYSVLTTGSIIDGKGNTITIPTGNFAVQCNFNSGAHGGYIPGVTGN
ncbi:MAG TPA: prepilin-type N-terminal cleavage/methylation domain-containing protein [Chthonomonadaceae bacterium]|nr:prepilin-type N-terminal cleavage/methylation domain-containing protein [Chthonomonadaceae bacterium]